MRGYFAIGIENGKHETNIGTLMRTAFNFGAAFTFSIGNRYRHQPSDTPKTDRSVPHFHYADLTDFHSHLPTGAELVGVEYPHDDAVPLRQLKHPRAAVYLLGAEDCGLSADAVAMCDRLTYIPSRNCLNVAVAGAIVLYDRVRDRASTPTNELATTEVES